MRKVLEKHIQKTILDFLKLKGLFCWKQNSSGIMKPNGSYIPSQMTGIADIIGLTRSGRFFAIEVKRPGEKPTENQIKFLFCVRESSGIAMVAHSLEEVLDNPDLWR